MIRQLALVSADWANHAMASFTQGASINFPQSPEEPSALLAKLKVSETIKHEQATILDDQYRLKTWRIDPAVTFAHNHGGRWCTLIDSAAPRQLRFEQT